MPDIPFTPLPPDQALHAFMDGELDLHDEQPLFDSLSADPELRSEMKDILSIRGAVHRDVVFPSPSIHDGILAATGLAVAGAGTAAGLGAASSVLVGAATSAPWWSGLSWFAYSVAGGVVGAVAMFLIMSPQEATRDIATGPPEQQQAPIVRVDTVYIQNAQVLKRTVVDVVPTAQTPTVEPERSLDVTLAQTIDPMNVSRNSFTTAERHETRYGSATSQGMLRTDRISSSSGIAPIILGFRTLATGLDATQPTPESVQSAMLPNTAFALMIPLNQQHRVGIEMGTESFTQTYTGLDGVHEAEWTQTPVLFWLGATYQFTPSEFRILPGLMPFAQATIGAAFSQGPVGRATIGLAYQPIGPIKFTLGLDGSALFYTFQNTWFTSTKWGLSYGLSIDLGAWH